MERRVARVLPLLFVFLLGVLAPGGCTCAPEPPRSQVPTRCHARKPASVPAPAPTPGLETVAAGTTAGTFSIASTGEATYVLPLVAVPGRAGVEPALSLTYTSAAGAGVLGEGFSISGLSAITRCPSNRALDGEIRAVRYDASDKLCLDGKRLIPVAQAPGTVEYRTFPDTLTRVIGHLAPGDAAPADALFFEATLPSGLTIAYGNSESGKPLARGGAVRAWLATKIRDGRGNAMTYAYCLEDGDGYTAEYALDEIRYTSFAGEPALEASRSVQFVYGAKDPADVRTSYAGGMEFSNSLRLDEIQMRGPGDALVRRYGLTYGLGPTTKRTLLTQVEECAADGVCKPPTRFQYQSSAAGFRKVPTQITLPTAKKASPMLADLDGDGLVELVVPDMDAALSTPQNPITNWRVAQNQGASASPPYFSPLALALVEDWPVVQNPTAPADPSLLQPEVGTPIDYDQDGRGDVFLHDVYGVTNTWKVLLSRPDHTFRIHDTGIARPFPLHSAPPPPTLLSAGGAAHLADVDGDGVPDLIQCTDHAETDALDPAAPVWMVHLWKPAHDQEAAGFALTGTPIEPLAGYRCDTQLYPVDLDGDGQVELVVQSVLRIDGTKQIPGATCDALRRQKDGSFTIQNTNLRIPEPGGRLLFLDVNGDGLPDAVESGSQDAQLYTFLNTGGTFAEVSVPSLGFTGVLPQDLYFGLAVPIDFNGDGRQDVLMPVPPGTAFNNSDALPAWAILQATGKKDGPTFTLVNPHLPIESTLRDAVTVADPRGARVGDLNGDGAQDVVLPQNGFFQVFENLAPDQDRLIAVSDGMNAHDPGEVGFVPNVSIAYGHLTDAAIPSGAAGADDPALERALYLAHADAANDCTYPRACAVGPRRVVSAYALNNGADGLRHFSVRYRDGRYHRLGWGFLGFGERIVTDLDTGAGTAEFYDITTSFQLGDREILPFVGQLIHQWRWFPGLPGQPRPSPVEIFFTDVTPSLVPTSDGKTYRTLPTERRTRHLQGSFSSSSPPSGAATVEVYVQQLATSGGATVLRDSTAKVAEVDELGFVRAEDLSTVGVDLTLHIERTFLHDTDRWVLGQLKTQTECSSAAQRSLCRTLTRTTTIYGEVETDAIDSDEGIPDTKLDVAYGRDVFGNVQTITADDAFGHHRVSSTTYDDEGFFPIKYVNAANQVTIPTFDARFGVLAKEVDPNQLVTEWKHDGFGRLVLETRPDGTTTAVKLARAKDGGPNHDAWQVTERTTTTGGADDTVAFDSLGRPIRWLSHGPSPENAGKEPPRVMQQIAYDALGEHVARRSVPVREGTAESEMVFDAYDYDSLGREARHTTPWKAVTETVHDGLQVRATDQSQDPPNVTVTEQDPLGRPVTITDAAQGITRYTYGPFGALETVTDPGGAVTHMTRDAFGRVRQLDDPDQGTTTSVHDGFGELVSSTDALGRVVTREYDPLGRPAKRVDQEGGKSLTTTWTWDTAANGMGRLQALESPDGTKAYTYNALSKLETVTLTLAGASEALQAQLDYDDLGRVGTITYPTPAGAEPFVVAQDYDAYGHVRTVRDSTTNLPYWRLTEVDEAGRYRTEVLGQGQKAVSTTRHYFADKQSLQSIVTEQNGTTVQDLGYDYDARLNLKSRTDALQVQNPTERFRYDVLDRLTCAYFSPTEDASVPCALDYHYAPNGNLTFKSDVGTLAYDDPAHPHAVTRAGNVSFGYNAVGNQVARPAGMTVTYTPFDLPKTITQGNKFFAFGYDGDEQRIRKTTPEQETVYLEGLYERVTTTAGAIAHRYSIHSPERVIAVVTRGGAQPGTRYLHVDHLGSVDALTDKDGKVVERRSYDPFGKRRNPVWGQPAPASFDSLVTEGFTGHESDDELGLVHMKGRAYDPRIGRFLTTDPLVSAPLSGQGWNPFSYVWNNPLSYVDPSGFAPGDGVVHQPGYPDIPLPNDRVTPSFTFQMARYLSGGPPPGPAPPPFADPPQQAAEVGAAEAPVDVDTTGCGAGYVPAPVPAEPQAWKTNPYVQIEGGGLAGMGLGAVPFAGVGEQLLDSAKVLPDSTPEARRGLAVGQIAGGFLTLTGGVTGEVLGGISSVSGLGAALGVPTIVISTGMVVGGLGNIAAGLHGLMTTGSGSSSPAATGASAGGEVWNKNGGVDFSKSEHLYPVKEGQKNIVKIKYTGSRNGDNRAANQAAGLGDSSKPPKGYTWHHLDDYDPATNTGTMQLVDADVHKANAPHVGGVKQRVDATGIPYGK